MEYIGYIASLVIGIVLGLIGGGGSILIIPILVYLFKVHPENATTYSLFVVGIAALVGSIQHYKLGNLKVKSALVFALPSIVSMLIVRKIVLPVMPDKIVTLSDFVLTKNTLIMLVFAILMIAASVFMIKKAEVLSDKITVINNNKLAFIGFLVGFITGFLGAGGGFLIIPALLFFAKLPIKQAVGTSLLIIFMNSSIGFVGDLEGNVTLNYQLLFTIALLAIFGMVLGTVLSKKIDGAKLKPAFGYFVFVMGLYIVAKEFFLNL